MQRDDQGEPLIKGDYVLATKYDDGDPGDPWAVGYYLEPGPPSLDKPRYRVSHADGRIIYGPNGFRRIRRGLRPDVGAWLMHNSAALEASPPGTVNLGDIIPDKPIRYMLRGIRAWEPSPGPFHQASPESS